MSENIYQIYQVNPITTIPDSALIYFGLSPYSTGDDAAMLGSVFKGLFPAASGTTGEVAYFNGSTSITSNSNLTFDGADLGIAGQLNVGGLVTFTDTGIYNTPPAVAPRYLQIGSNGVLGAIASGAGGYISGSGTTNYVPVFNGTESITGYSGLQYDVSNSTLFLGYIDYANGLDAGTFGVVYNNSSVDNTAALQAAINAASAQGVPLLISGVVYCNNSTPIVISNSLYIIGTATWAFDTLFCGFLQQNLACQPFINVTSNNRVDLRNLAIGYGSQQTAGTCIQYTPSGGGAMWHPIIDNCYIFNAYNGILWNDVVTGTIKDSLLAGQQTGQLSGSRGIAIIGINHIDNGDSTIQNCDIFANDVGIYQESNGGLRIINNKIIGNNTTYHLNIGAATSDLFFTGNSVESSNVGILLTAQGSNQFLDVCITGNEIAVNDTCIQVSANGSNTIWMTGLAITGNYFATGGSTCTAVKLAGTRLASITGNTYLATDTGTAQFLTVSAECNEIAETGNTVTVSGPTLLPNAYTNTDGSAHTSVFGYNCNSNGAYTTAMGYYSTAVNGGSWVVSDASSTTPVSDSMSNQLVFNFANGFNLNGGLLKINGVSALTPYLLLANNNYTSQVIPPSNFFNVSWPTIAYNNIGSYLTVSSVLVANDTFTNSSGKNLFLRVIGNSRVVSPSTMYDLTGGFSLCVTYNSGQITGINNQVGSYPTVISVPPVIELSPGQSFVLSIFQDFTSTTSGNITIGNSPSFFPTNLSIEVLNP